MYRGKILERKLEDEFWNISRAVIKKEDFIEMDDREDGLLSSSAKPEPTICTLSAPAFPRRLLTHPFCLSCTLVPSRHVHAISVPY